MITAIRIENFRGYRMFECDGLAGVTILAGKNNSGKSSMLEAAYLTMDPSSAKVLETIHAYRGCVVDQVKSFESLFYGADLSKPIRISTTWDDGTRRHVAVTYHEPTVDIQSTAVGGTMDGESFEKAVENSERLELSVGIEKNNNSEHFSGKCYCIPQGKSAVGYTSLKTPASVRGHWVSAQDRGYAEKRLIELYKAGKTQVIDDVLATIDPRVRGITPIENTIYVKMDGVDRRIPLSALGDGMVKIVSCLSVVLSVQPGDVCAFDEIENGLHYSAMRAFWSGLVTLARQRKVQLLCTTHNWELLSMVSSQMDEEATADFSFIRMGCRKPGEIVHTTFGAEAFKAHMDGEIEVR